MIRSTLLLAVLLAMPVWAHNAIINCASTTLATTYSTSSPSLALSQVPTKSPQSHLAVINNSGSRICVNTDTASVTVAPTAGTGHEHCIAPNMFAFYDDINVNNNFVNIYARADVSSCTTGTIDLDLW
jgi:hypothetical protein